MNGNNDGIRILTELYSPFAIPSAHTCGNTINIPKNIIAMIQANTLFNQITAFQFIIHNIQHNYWIRR